MKTLTCVAIWAAFTLGFASAQQTSTVKDEPAGLIAEVQGTPASTFDSNLLRIPFEEWVRRQIGKDASVAWVVRSGAGDDLPYVEADVSVGDQPGIVIMIACGNRNEKSRARPIFKSLELVRQGEFAEWRHLHDLPVAMRKARGES